jgi:ABC-2 type transport system permease protein
MVMLKGAGFQEIKMQLGIIALFAFAINGLAVWSYKKSN